MLLRTPTAMKTLRPLLLFVSVLVLPGLIALASTRSAYAQEATFGSLINVSNTSEVSYVPQIGLSGSNVYVVWLDNTPGNAEVFFSRSTDGGATFDAPTNLSNTTPQSDDVRMAVSGSNVYVVWYEDVERDIFFARSTNDGASFGSAVNLSNNTDFSTVPDIAVSGSNVYILYSQFINSFTYELTLLRSTDNGATFGAPVALGNLTNVPRIAAAGSYVHVVWQYFPTGSNKLDIFYKRSTDGGASFGGAVELSNNSGRSFIPHLTASGSNVYVAWTDNTGVTPGNDDIFFVASTDNGGRLRHRQEPERRLGLDEIRVPGPCRRDSGVRG